MLLFANASDTKLVKRPQMAFFFVKFYKNREVRGDFIHIFRITRP